MPVQTDGEIQQEVNRQIEDSYRQLLGVAECQPLRETVAMRSLWLDQEDRAEMGHHHCDAAREAAEPRANASSTSRPRSGTIRPGRVGAPEPLEGHPRAGLTGNGSLHMTPTVSSSNSASIRHAAGRRPRKFPRDRSMSLIFIEMIIYV